VVDKRTSRPQKTLTWFLAAALLVLVVDPFGIFIGSYSQDSYSQIRSDLSQTDNAKVLLVGSWDDFYSLEYNSYWRKELGEEFVERNYSEVLDAASLGNEYFNRFLHSKGITHVLVPQNSFERGAIRHKFSNRGSIEILLGDPYFKAQSSSTGPYPSVLLRVELASSVNIDVSKSKYEITWKNVDWWFYTKQIKKAEVGLYAYSYETIYEWGPDVSWMFDLSPERSSDLEIVYLSSSNSLNKVRIELTLIAAYGLNAPPHMVSVTASTKSETRILSPAKPEVFKYELRSGESVIVKNITPCRYPKTFEPKDQSSFKICLGVSKLVVLPQSQEE
jgi:hypothetical protein